MVLRTSFLRIVFGSQDVLRAYVRGTLFWVYWNVLILLFTVDLCVILLRFNARIDVLKPVKHFQDIQTFSVYTRTRTHARLAIFLHINVD